MKPYLLLTLLLITTANNAYSCECIQRGILTTVVFNETPLVFIGRFVRQVKKDTDGNLINEYKVERWYKGKTDNDYIQIASPDGSGGCGLGELSPNKQYLIYAYYRGAKPPFTARCYRTTYVPNHTWADDATTIEAHQKLNVFGEIYMKNVPSNFHADTLFLNRLVNFSKGDGVQNIHYPDGRLLSIGKYKDGKPVGYWEYYKYDRDNRASGQISGNYINGNKDSIWKDTYKSSLGNTSLKLTEYKNGEPTLWEKKYRNGKIQEEVYPIKGTNKWINKRYHTNGKLNYIVTHGPIIINEYGYKELGEADGPAKYYHYNGQLRTEGVYYKGQWIGVWKEYDNKGQLIKTSQEGSKQEVDKKLRKEK